jgi:hypothetical protein
MMHYAVRHAGLITGATAAVSWKQFPPHVELLALSKAWCPSVMEEVKITMGD